MRIKLVRDYGAFLIETEMGCEDFFRKTEITGTGSIAVPLFCDWHSQVLFPFWDQEEINTNRNYN
ncbi:MAG: hypothetical protein MI975_11970 [Cytophagales bacterium]|nr:hypothetical protein [Cytophagales bacterium]